MVELDDLVKGIAFKCEKCASKRIVIFEGKGFDILIGAYACFGCHNFQIFCKDKEKLQAELTALENA